MAPSACLYCFGLVSSWVGIAARVASAGVAQRVALVAVLLVTVSLAMAPLAAAQTDADCDGLFDGDETAVYGTDPGVADSDGDGSSDGEEIYLGTDPLSPPSR